MGTDFGGVYQLMVPAVLFLGDSRKLAHPRPPKIHAHITASLVKSAIGREEVNHLSVQFRACQGWTIGVKESQKGLP